MKKDEEKKINKSSITQKSKKKQQNKLVNPKKKSIKDKIIEFNDEFDESIYFNHRNTFFTKLSVEKPISKKNIPFLIETEFEFSYFEEKIKKKETNKESISEIL